jgi:aspartate/methionine/tyrosine aminotransferase
LTDADASPIAAAASPAAQALPLGSHNPDPRGRSPAREAVARYYADRGVAVDPDDIVLTASTSEAYAHLFRVLGEPESIFAAPRPSYPLFEPLAHAEGVRIEPWRLVYDGAWHLDSASLAGSDPCGVIVVQPNNPTGTWLAPGDLARVESWCASTGAVLIGDEVFGDYAWREGIPGAESLLARGRAVPTVVMSGLSKVCGLPQAKLSWMVVAGPEPARCRLLEALEWIADLFLSVNGPAQDALPRLLAARHAFQGTARERLRVNLARVQEAVANQPSLTMLRAEGGWVVVLRIPRVRTEEAWALELLRRGVVVHPGHFYDIEDEAHLVLSLIVVPRTFDAGLAVIEALAAEGQ